MWNDHTTLSAARILSALLGGLLFAAALRAYTASRRRSLLALACGAGALTLGYILAGTLVEILGWSVAEATMVESLFTLVAVGLIVLSLYLRDAQRDRRREATFETSEVAHV